MRSPRILLLAACASAYKNFRSFQVSTDVKIGEAKDRAPQPPTWW